MFVGARGAETSCTLEARHERSGTAGHLAPTGVHRRFRSDKGQLDNVAPIYSAWQTVHHSRVHSANTMHTLVSKALLTYVPQLTYLCEPLLALDTFHHVSYV